jgi:hypothetical protein
MNTINATNTNSFFIATSLCARGSLREYVAALLGAAERAQLSRDRARLTELIAQLRKLPLNKWEQNCLGYYEAWSELASLPNSRGCLYRLAETAPLGYRVRSLMTVGGLAALGGDLNTALRDHAEAMKMVRFTREPERYILSCFLLRNQASIIGLGGDQKGALNRLREIGPLARAVARIHPVFGLEYLNAIANELLECGHHAEARYVISVPAAAPLAMRFPEWIESRRTIERSIRTRNHSTIVVPAGLPPRPPPPNNVHPFPTHRIRRGHSERLLLVANLIDILLDRGVPENLLRLVNRLIVRAPSEDFIQRTTTLLDRDRRKASGQG